MANIPNQNTISEIIKSNIENMDSVIEAVINSTNSIAKLASGATKNIETYSTLMHTIFDEGGLYNMITENIIKFNDASKIKINKKGLRNFRKNVKLIYIEINQLANDLGSYSKISFPKIEINGFNNIVSLIKDIMKIGNEENFFTLQIKFFKIRRTIKRIVKGLNNLDVSIDTAKFKEADKGFEAAKNGIENIMEIVNSAPLFPLWRFRLKNLKKIIAQVVIICETISLISSNTLKNANINTKELSKIFASIKDLFKSILKTGAGPLVRMNLKLINGSIKKLVKTLGILEKIKINKKIITKLTTITLIVGSMALLFTSIALLTPVWLIGTIAVLLLFAVIKLFSFIMRFIITTLVNLAAKRVMKGMLALLLIGALLTAIAVMFLLMSTMAEDIVKQSLWIFAMLGVIIAVVGLLTLVGIACASAALILIPAAIAIAVITAVVGLLLLMSLMLKEFEKINLDGKKIKENVNLVLSVAKDIISSVFVSDEIKDEKSEKSWIGDILTFVGGAIAPVIKAIMAVAFLALMVVGICMILLIAGMLKIIQELDIDQNKIKENVRIILTTAQEIIDLLFKAEDQNAKKSNKSWIESVIEYIGGGLVKIIKAIFAVAYLALIVVAILFITLIATELRILQCLDLDPEKIKQNVGLVISTAQMVISSLFDQQDKDAVSSNRGWIVTVISWFSPSLATIVEAIMAIAFLATMIVCILLINILARELKTLQEIVLDPALISANVTIVIDTCQMVVDSVMGRTDREDSPSSKGWIRKLFEWIGADGLIQIIDCIMAIAWLGMTVALINMVTMLANQLKMLQDIKLDKNKITTNTEVVCNTADAVSAAVLGRPNPIKGDSDGPLGKVLRWLFPSLAEAVDMMTKMKWVSGIMSTVGIVKQVADTLLTLNNLPDLSGVKSKVEYVCNTADSIVALVTSRPSVPLDDAESRISWMERINKTVREMQYIRPDALNKSKKALGAHIALIKQIKTVDVQKLETSAKMFYQMARFSESIKGNFKKLAETLNEDLMPILEELKEIMGTVPEKLDNGFQNTSASIAATNAPATTENITAQVNRENPNLSQEDVEKIVKTRITENAKSEANGVAAKIDELISLFKGYSGDHAIVQTI